MGAEVTSGPAGSRRTFLNWLLGTSVGALAAAVLYPIVRYLIPPPASESAAQAVTLDFGPETLAPNTARIFRFGGRPGILVHTASGELRAFSAACTHLGCIVQYRPDLEHVWCACHNGHFDLNGRNILGPPPSPLESYAVNVRDGRIVVSRDA